MTHALSLIFTRERIDYNAYRLLIASFKTDGLILAAIQESGSLKKLMRNAGLIAARKPRCPIC